MSLDLRKINKKVFYFLFITLALFFTQTVFAAELKLSPSQGSYKVGDTIKVRIVLSSPSESANAISGKLSFSKEILSLTSVSKTNSLIGLWAVNPNFSNANGSIDMEGIILTGYAGTNGTVLSLSFKAKAVGDANIKFTSSSILANDGQGTNILTGAGQANFNISKAADKVVVSENSKSVVQSPSIKIQELKKKDEMDAFSSFLITSVGKKEASSYKIEIDNVESPWLNSDSGIFQTPALAKGTHTLKVSMVTVNSDIISNSVYFSIKSILVPVFTEFAQTVKEKDYIVVKGIADPNINVVISSKINPFDIVSVGSALPEEDKIQKQEIIVKSDDKGLFTYVSEKALAGIYEITAHSVVEDGIESAKSLPISIKVVPASTPISNMIVSAFSTVIPIVALLILLSILAIWGWYKVLHYHEHSRAKLLHTKSIINKSFDILDDDVNEQIRILKKIKALQPLTPDERTFANQFKKDIEDSEKVILNEIKD